MNKQPPPFLPSISDTCIGLTPLPIPHIPTHQPTHSTQPLPFYHHKGSSLPHIHFNTSYLDGYIPCLISEIPEPDGLPMHQKYSSVWHHSTFGPFFIPRLLVFLVILLFVVPILASLLLHFSFCLTTPSLAYYMIVCLFVLWLSPYQRTRKRQRKSGSFVCPCPTCVPVLRGCPLFFLGCFVCYPFN